MYSIYVIKEGDTIDSIAKEFNTTKQVLYDLNSIIPNTILEVGRRIIVPNQNSQILENYVVKKGDTVYSIAQKYNTSSNVIANINGLEDNEYIYENEILLVPVENVNVYVTREGDTIDTVLKKLDCTLDDLISNNKNIYMLEDQLLVYRKKTLGD